MKTSKLNRVTRNSALFLSLISANALSARELINKTSQSGLFHPVYSVLYVLTLFSFAIALYKLLKKLDQNNSIKRQKLLE